MGLLRRIFGKGKDTGGDSDSSRSARRRGGSRSFSVRDGYRDLPKDEWTDDEYDHFMQTCTDDEYWADWEAWSRETYEHPSIRRIRRSVLDLALAAARDSYPQEFAAQLRVEGDTVSELVLLLGTIQGDEHCILPLGNAPVDPSIKGSLHSHPDTHPYPSDADFELFEHHGTIHLILCEPYGPDDWRAYDHTGLPVHLDVVGDRRDLPGARPRRGTERDSNR